MDEVGGAVATAWNVGDSTKPAVKVDLRSTCPGGAVSPGKETELSEYVSEWCGVFCKETELSEYVSERCGVFCKEDRAF